MVQALKNSWISLLFCWFIFTDAWEYKHCPDDFDADIPQSCFSSTSEIAALQSSLLSAGEYDLRVMTFNTFDWNAGRDGHSRIRQWLEAVLPTVDVVGFQEFGYSSLNSFVQSFGFVPLHNNEGKDLTIYVRGSSFVVEENDQVKYTSSIGKDACSCNVDYHRYVNYARVRTAGRTIHLANNHGCVGGCGGSSTAYGGTAILESLNNKGFFQNSGANSIFMGDVNYWNNGGVIYSDSPKGLCRPYVFGSPVGEMSLRGKLQCGPGHDLDFVGYGRNFRAVKHYSFSGAGNYNGDSDHKAVMLDLEFIDGSSSTIPVEPVPAGDLITATWVGRDSCQPSSPCNDGESDCDLNSDCAGDLICWERTNGETDPRYDTSNINSDADVCIRPESSEDVSNVTYVQWLGPDACADSPCGDGESDCDKDSECQGDLICWERTYGETDPRYDTSGINANADVCIRPLSDSDSSTDASPPSTDPASDSAQSCTGEEIVVATYNIMYTTCPGYYNGCQCSNTGPSNYAADTVQPDILGTQENGCQVDFGVEMGSPYAVTPYDCQQCNHNAIYYNSGNTEYAGASGYEEITRDSYSVRMYSWVRVKTKGGFYFWVFNTHLPHTYGSHEDIAKQMINKWNLLAGGEPAVFIGDFNPHKDNDAWEKYAVDHGLTKVGSGSGGVCGFCDQIYYSTGDFKVISDRSWGTGGSDHTVYSAVLQPACESSDASSAGSDTASDTSTDSGSSDTSADTSSSTILVEFLGDDACTTSSPCEDGKADCDDDSDCVGSLVCWQRTYGETRDGYDTSAIGDNRDVCVQPKMASPIGDDLYVVGTMSDEFSGSVLDESVWEIQHWDASWKNNEKQCYVPSNLKMESGNLVLEATERTYYDSKCNAQQYFSGSVETRGYWLHGTIEVRAKIPSGQGLWPAIWLLGDNSKVAWPACGEIDLMEVAGEDPMGAKATLHYGPRYGGSINLHFGNTPVVPLKEDFHVWRIDRSSNSMTMYFDGVEIGHKTRAEILATSYPNAETMFDEPMRVILNIAVGGDFTGIGNAPPDVSTWDKPSMEIDYVRVWSTTDVDTQAKPTTESCLDTMACAGDTCASCADRIDWVTTNLDKTYEEAVAQIESEFPSECVCGSCLDKTVCNDGTCATCADRIDWVMKNLDKTYEEAQSQIESEFPTQCVCASARRNLEDTLAHPKKRGATILLLSCIFTLVIFFALFTMARFLKKNIHEQRVMESSEDIELAFSSRNN